MSQKFHPVTHVIFDCDGLLVDSEKYYTIALTEAAKKYGKEFTFQIKVEMMGQYGDSDASFQQLLYRNTRKTHILTARQHKSIPSDISDQAQSPLKAPSFVWKDLVSRER